MTNNNNSTSFQISLEYFHTSSTEIENNSMVLHDISVELARDETRRALMKGHNVFSTILIDDAETCHSTKVELVNSLLMHLKGLNYEPNSIVFESELSPIIPVVLEGLQDKHVYNSLVRYRNQKGKIPCSLKIAAWYLLRLGLITPATTSTGGFIDDKFFSNKVVSILPFYCKPPEDRAELIIHASKWADKANDRIIQKYYHTEYLKNYPIMDGPNKSMERIACGKRSC